MIRRVSAAETHPLRQRVLRPHQAVAEVGFPGEDHPETAHFAAFTDDRIVGIVTVLRQPPQPALEGVDPAACWRLRGMATAEDQRRRGFGAALVKSALAHVAEQGGQALWCHARLGAAAFYQAAGFVATGDPWEEPGLGPHVRMWRAVP